MKKLTFLAIIFLVITSQAQVEPTILPLTQPIPIPFNTIRAVDYKGGMDGLSAMSSYLINTLEPEMRGVLWVKDTLYIHIYHDGTSEPVKGTFFPVAGTQRCIASTSVQCVMGLDQIYYHIDHNGALNTIKYDIKDNTIDLKNALGFSI